MSDLGTARGRVVIDPSGAVTGFGTATRAGQSFDQQMQSVSSRATHAGKVVAGSGLVIVGGLAVAINSAANFEERMSAVGAVSNASGKEMDQLRQLALQLGADTKFSANEAAGALEELVKAGVPLEDVLTGAADAAVNLAAAGEIDLAEAASIASAALNTFNLEGRDMSHVADLIAGAANTSAIDVHEFGESLKQSGAAAALVGLSFDDLSLAIAAMGNAGIKGSDAGTSLKTFLLNLQPTTQKQIDLMKQLGLVTEDGTNQFFDQTGSLKSLTEISGLLNGALSGMTDQQKTMALETLFGTDAIRAAAVITNEGAEGFTALAESMAAISAEDVAEERMDNFRGSLEQLKGSLETVLIAIGTPFLSGLRGIAEMVTTLANRFLELSPSTQEMIGKILAISAVILILVGGIALLVGWVSSVIAAFSAIGAVLGVLIGPVGLVILLIIALVAGIIYLWNTNEGFRNALIATWEFIKNSVIPAAKDFIAQVVEIGRAIGHWLQDVGIPAIQRFIEQVVAIGQAIGHWFRDVGIPAILAFVNFITETVVPAITTLASEVQERLASAFGWLQTNVFPIFAALGALIVAVADIIATQIGVIIQVIQFLGPVWEAIWRNIQRSVSLAIEIIRSTIEHGVNIILIIWNLLADNLWSAIQIAWNLIIGIVESALQIIRGIIQIVTGIITLDWDTAWTGIKNVFAGLWNGLVVLVVAALNAIWLAIITALDLIHAAWNIAWELVHLVIEVVWAAIVAMIQGALDVIWQIIQLAIDALLAFWSATWGAVLNILVSTWLAIVSAVTSAISSVISFLAALPGQAVSALGDVLSTLWQKGWDLIQGLINGLINNGFNMIANITAIPGAVLGAIGDVAGILYDKGVDIVQGLIDGISSMLEDVRDIAGDIASAVTGPLGSALSILSPSKVLMKMGQQVIEGLVVGISDTRRLEAQMGEIANAITRPVNAAAAATPAIAGGVSEISLTFNFPNVRSADDAQQIEDALDNSEVLNRILHATRAGVGGRI